MAAVAPLRRDQHRNHPRSVRLSIDELQRYLDRRVGYRLNGGLHGIARYLGVPYDQVQKWASRSLGIHSAEEVAAGLGCHPWDIWGDAYWEMTGVEL